MKSLLVLGVALASALTVQAADTKGKAEEGDWAVSLKPKPGNNLKGTTTPYDDVVTLKDGKLQSKVLGRYEFDAAPYTAKTVGKVVEITAVQKHDGHGNVTWTLHLEDGKVSGKLVWVKVVSTAEFDISPKAAGAATKKKK